MSHGGKRRNAGRPRAVPAFLFRMAIGAMCEQVRRAHAEREALRRLDNEREEIRKIQSRIDAETDRYGAIYLKLLHDANAPRMSVRRALADLERWKAIALKKIAAEVTPALKKLDRGVSLAKYRPRALPRAEVYREVAAECERVGLGTVSTHQIRDCWREYLQHQKS